MGDKSPNMGISIVTLLVTTHEPPGGLGKGFDSSAWVLGLRVPGLGVQGFGV